MNKKKYLSVLSVAAITGLLSIATANTVLAANGDLYKLDTKEMVLSNEKTFKEKFKFGLSIAESTQEYGYEYNGKIYNFKEANEAASKVEEKTKENVLKAMEEIKEVGLAEDFNQGLVVNSVSAITTEVDANADEQMLGFTVNNGKEVTLKELADASYTIQFLASKAVFEASGAAASTSATGELREEALNADDTFKYQVKISKDGEVIAESELVEVTVQDQANLVTSISAVELYVTQNGKDVKVESGKLATGDTAKVKVVGRTAAMAADAKDDDITAKVTLSTDKIAVATVAANGTITQSGAKGDVTITAKAGDITKAITVNASNAARAVDATKSTVTPASLELATGDSTDIIVALKDQYGDTFVPTASDVATVATNNADGNEIAGEVIGSSIEDDLTVKLSLTADSTNAGTGKVVVNHSSTKLAEINLTVKAPGEIAEYKLETADKKYELDLKGNASPTLQLLLNGYDAEGLLVGPETLGDYSFESSNEKVATVDNETTKGKVTAVAPGTATIKVYKTEDAFKTAVAKVEITVKDSTPAITDAKVVAPEKMTEAGAIDLAKIFTEVTAVDPEGKAVEVNDFSDEKVTVGETSVEIGSFLVTTVKAEESTASATISEGKINVTGAGKATINIALLNAKGEIVKDVNVEVDIPAAPADDGTDGQ